MRKLLWLLCRCLIADWGPTNERDRGDGKWTQAEADDASATINSQRSLIHLLFKDNLHLTAKKTTTDAGAYGKIQAQAQSPSSQIPLTQVPSTQIPLIQVPPLQVPSGKENPRAGTKPGRKSRKAEKALPTRPPAELTDPSDMRRVSIAI